MKTALFSIFYTRDALAGIMHRVFENAISERKTRLGNMTWLLVGLYQSRSVHLSKVAEKIPGRATLLSLTGRIMRFLDNPAIRVRDWYELVATTIIQRLAHTNPSYG